MPRYKLTVAYDGTGFLGWQRQLPTGSTPLPKDERLIIPRLGVARGGDGLDDAVQSATGGERAEESGVELRTVQAVLERAVREAVRQPVRVMGASRTDSGVHARGQVAAFSTLDGHEQRADHSGWPEERGTDPLVAAINARLPEDVLVVGAQIVDEHFDPIGGALDKCYSYTIYNHAVRPVFERRFATHVRYALDVAKMREACAWFVGEHDFGAFAAAGHGRTSTVRAVHTLDVESTGRRTPRTITIRVSGSGFLWNMVRIIAGTLVEIGRGRLVEADIRAALETGDRRKAGPTMHPEGLCLEWIRYPADP